MIQKPIYNDSLNQGYGNENKVSKNFNNNTNGNSRIIKNTEDLRKVLISRNLYTPNDQYPLQENTRQKIVNTTSKVLDVLMPFKSFNLSNSIVGRLTTLPNTPITDIGMLMLSKQMGYNVASNVAQATFPQLNLSNLFNGGRKSKKGGYEGTNEGINNENNIIALPKNFKITKSLVDSKFRNGLEAIFGTQFTTVNPFKKGASNIEYLDNTGKQQIGYLYGQLSKNMYKPYDSQDYKMRYGFVISNRDKNITNSDETYLDDKIWFDPTNLKFNPYHTINSFNRNDILNIEKANQNMINAYQYDTNQNYKYFYGGTYEFISDLGKSEIIKETGVEIDSSSNDNGFNDTDLNNQINNNIVWGNEIQDETGDFSSTFNIKHGLLEYTRNLVKATSGKHINLDKYGFKDKNGNTYYNGSRLINPPDDSMFAGQKYVRQHKATKQYGLDFDKAIRYKGNNFYNGNENSIIYDNVLPQITPKLNSLTNKIDTRKLMFSIENLAIDVTPHDDKGYGEIQDGYNTQVPLCEVSENRHRIMWFPPYDIKLVEVTNSNYNTINFLGRTEPIYTYTNSERTATLIFKMLIDHPPQLKKGATYKEYADFFAFGGRMEDGKKPNITNEDKTIDENNKIIEQVSNTIKVPEKKTKRTYIFFPNDEPKVGGELSIMDRMYYILKYEPISNKKCVDGQYSFGFNKNIYYKGSGNTITLINLPDNTYDIDNRDIIITNPVYSQYTHPYDPTTEIDKLIYNFYKDKEFNKYFNIKIIGKATKLYTPNNPNDLEEEIKYNKELGLRRAEAVKYYVEERIKKIFNENPNNLDIKIEVDSIGSVKSAPENATIQSISSESAKMERSTEVIFYRNNIAPEVIIKPDNSAEKEIVKTAQETNNDITTKNKDKFGCTYNNTKLSKSNYNSIKDNYYNPVFHSQTPEDFHNRLTFLQQCMRPGKPVQGYLQGCSSKNLNSSFGKQPICVLRIADFFFTKIVIDNLTIDYNDASWDTNPEGFGMQPMIANVTLQIKIIGGQSLRGPIDQLQNAISYNYYANSDFSKDGVHKTASDMTDKQYSKKNNDKKPTDEQLNLINSAALKI